MASTKNERRMIETLAIQNGGHVAIQGRPRRIPTIKGSKRGRKPRTTRPSRSAGKRTNPGEERYLLTLSVQDIADMKTIAELSGKAIKQVFAEAVGDYRKKNLPLL